MLEREYTNVEPAKPPPPIPVRVSRKSQLMAALQQNARPIVIEDHDLAGPFARLLRARELRLWAFGGLVADTMSFAMSRSYGADIESHWYIGHYVLPGNVQKVTSSRRHCPTRRKLRRSRRIDHDFQRSPRALALSAFARKRPYSGHRWTSQKCPNRS